MITINYQMFGNKGFQLRLRLYQDGETKFINVTKLLKGSIQKRHWNQKKQLFIPSCTSPRQAMWSPTGDKIGKRKATKPLIFQRFSD
ncbi:hypothetical protein EEL39_14835 [Muribaculaceae bacterium Isolate-080 (Janvier)]|jgi:hypothetical protein|nr:hypothetical protein EEL39_14835 [Muribaculaceae bacterium Isolate-080 (Janvier)]